jgi:sec-independent protein translocase protein TatC
MSAPPPPPPKEGEPNPEDDVQLTLMGHLEELRVRLRNAVAAALVGVAVAYGFSDVIFKWLMAPVYDALPEGERVMIFTSLVEPFFVYLKIAAYAGLFAASPVILYQVWAFVSPGLYRKERRMMVPFVLFGTVFFVGGALFARYVIMPYAFEYLVKGFAYDGLKAMPSMGEQLTLVLVLLLAFAIIFEMPLVMTLLAKMGVVSSKTLVKSRKVMTVVNVVAAAIITPTGDPFNLALMAVPMILFYELGILGAKLVEAPADPAAEAAAAALDADDPPAAKPAG